MYEFFGFDPKTLSNEELFDKHLALTAKKVLAARTGKVDAANQLQMMIAAIEFERRERIFNERIGSVVLSSSPVVIETEIDLREPEPTEEQPKITKGTARPIRRAVRTSKPVIPSSE